MGNSNRAVREFNALAPPPALQGPFGEYVEARERVNKYDRQANAVTTRKPNAMTWLARPVSKSAALNAANVIKAISK